MRLLRHCVPSRHRRTLCAEPPAPWSSRLVKASRCPAGSRPESRTRSSSASRPSRISCTINSSSRRLTSGPPPPSHDSSRHFAGSRAPSSPVHQRKKALRRWRSTRRARAGAAIALLELDIICCRIVVHGWAGNRHGLFPCQECKRAFGIGQDLRDGLAHEHCAIFQPRLGTQTIRKVVGNARKTRRGRE